MPLTSYAIDTFVAQGLSCLEPPELPPLLDECPDHSSWLTAFVLNRMFRSHVSPERTPLACVLLRRAEAAFDEWRLAREALSEVGSSRTVSAYFRTLRHFENLRAALWQCYDFARRTLKSRAFEPRDGSDLQRLNAIYNTFRHFDPSDLPTGELHALRIVNGGLCTVEDSLTFEELVGQLRQIGRIAHAIATGDRGEPSRGGGT